MGFPSRPSRTSRCPTRAKPMLLRACDIVQAGEPANAAEDAADAPKPAQSADAATSLSAKIEALEAAIAQTEDQWEPDGDSEDAYSGTPSQSLPWNVEAEFAAAEAVGSIDIEQADASDDESEAHVQAEFIRSPRVETEVIAEPAVDDRRIDMDEEDLRAFDRRNCPARAAGHDGRADHAECAQDGPARDCTCPSRKRSGVTPSCA